MSGLGLFVPSLSRPHNAARLQAAMQDTCTAGTTLIIGLNEEDPRRDEYPPGPRYMVRPRLRYVTAWLNAMAAELAAGYEFIGTLGDDNVPETPGWDARVIKALGSELFCYADDGYPLREPGLLACHIFMRREVADILGYVGPPEIGHLYVDVAWTAWCTGCGHEYLHDVMLRHVHYTAGAPHDATYAASLARHGADFAAWHAYSRREGPGGLNHDIIKLGGTPFTAAALGEFNRGLGIPEMWL